MTKGKTLNLDRYNLIGAGFFVSGLACLDLLLVVFCAGFPLLFYLVAGAVGFLVGGKSRTSLVGHGALKKLFKGVALTGCFLGLLSAGTLTLRKPNWNTKCSFRYCGKALSGFSLSQTPYPVGTPNCRGLWLCANEAQMNTAQKAELDRLIEVQGCPIP